MICDYQTNKVYLALGLTHYMPMCKNLLFALMTQRIPITFPAQTKSPKHVWIRDYMPVQISENSFLQSVYSPDYLKGQQEYIPDYNAIDKDLQLNCISTDIVLDGGNVIKCGNKVIITDKILAENRSRYKKKELLTKLEQLFEADVILIPRDRYDEYGHADGMVRYIEAGRVLLNNYVDFDPDLRKRLMAALSPHFEVEELHYGARCSKDSWAYLNFLQTKGCILVPGLGHKEDISAMEQIKEFYPQHKVIIIDGCRSLVRDGGALNCCSWNVFE